MGKVDFKVCMQGQECINSYYKGYAKGCEFCMRGEKLVLFITGLCDNRCFYCPVSELKFGKDMIYANERKVESFFDVLDEVNLTDAKGAGITGGDPLKTLDKTVDFIKKMKIFFGKKFHIHLYTPLTLVNENTLSKLYEAGLDEIRFHPDIFDDSLWDRMKLAKKYKWSVGIEIPVLPGHSERVKKLMLYAVDIVEFFNLNELELSDTKVKHYRLHDLRYEPKHELSYGVKGSEEEAIKLIEWAKQQNLSYKVYYCSAKLKDGVQLKNRLKRRAKNIAMPWEVETEEGTLIRGVIYAKDYEPSSSYLQHIMNEDKETALKSYEVIISQLRDMGLEDYFYDDFKKRLLVPIDFLEEHAEVLKSKGMIPAIVEEYPTDDGLEVEIIFL
ncbi:MAG: radical SAM protein [Candidatus Nanohaloarchaeota archaeon]|nr:radical SAM protein [Candidatus Nanohaloarchaeota archaeon]